MADPKPVLVLHLTSGGEPLTFALSTEETEKLQQKLPGLLKSGGVETVQTKEDSAVSINFAHVAAAYLDDLTRKSKVFGLHS